MFHHSRSGSYSSTTPYSDRRLKNLTYLLFGLLAFLYLWGHQLAPLFDVDEAIFTQASAEMVSTGNYIGPTYNGEPRYHKPPLIYWLQALSLSVQQALPYQEDVTARAARLPSAMAGLLAVIVFYVAVFSMTGRRRFALTAAAVLGVSLSWLVIVRAATADGVLNLLILSPTMLMLWVLYRRQSSRWVQGGIGLLLALGLLAKGPVALVVPAVAVGLATLVRPGMWASIKLLNPLLIGGVMIAGVLPWVGFIIHQSGIDFFKEFILVHNLGRFTGDLGNTQSASPFFYIFVVLVGFFPWSVLLVTAVPAVMKDWFLSLRRAEAHLALPLIGLIWAVTVVVLFSFSQTKLMHYIVPALPGFALFVAGYVEALPLSHTRKLIPVLGVPVALALGGFLLLFNGLLVTARPGESHILADKVVALLGVPWPPAKPEIAALLSQAVELNLAVPFAGIILILGSSVGFILLGKGFRQGVALLVLTQAAVLSLLVVGTVPIVGAYLQKPLTELATVIKDEGEGATIYYYGLHRPSVRLVSGRPFVEVHGASQLENELQQGRSLVLVEEHRQQEVLDVAPVDSDTKNLCIAGFCVVEVTSWPKK
jgi:4-amino-4-deoxy-L-arabinose transferase-like glycosyltransferase